MAQLKLKQNAPKSIITRYFKDGGWGSWDLSKPLTQLQLAELKKYKPELVETANPK